MTYFFSFIAHTKSSKIVLSGEREKRPFTIDFKPFVFFFVYVYTFFFTVIFINKGDLMEEESSLFAD